MSLFAAIRHLNYIYAFQYEALFLTEAKTCYSQRREEITESVVQWSDFLATDPEVRARFLALPDFLRNSGPGTGSTQRS
jgi:hypothetical protein